MFVDQTWTRGGGTTGSTCTGIIALAIEGDNIAIGRILAAGGSGAAEPSTIKQPTP